MSWVDIVIAVVVLIATERGFALGFLRQLGAIVGLLTGFVIGTLLAPFVASRVSVGVARPSIAITCVVVLGLLGAFIGRRLGSAANLAMRRSKLGKLDRAAGAAFALVGSLLVCWLVAGMLVNVSVISLSSAIAHSRILTVMDDVMPPVPSVEAKMQALFREADFPSVFAQVVAPHVPSGIVPPSAEALATLQHADRSVVKIGAVFRCDADREGTGFIVAPHLVMTAAHVVAGAGQISIGTHTVQLVYLDARNDIALLRVPAVLGPSLSFAASEPTHTDAAIPGYPLNGSESVISAAVLGPIDAQGRDIYDQALITRTIEVLAADVQPGHSGAPVIVHGRVVAMVFSRSTTDSATAYAVPLAELRAAVARGASHEAISTGACPSE